MKTRSIDFRHQLFSIREAAVHLRVSRSMIYRLTAAGKLKPTKLGRRTIISGDQIEQLLAELSAA